MKKIKLMFFFFFSFIMLLLINTEQVSAKYMYESGKIERVHKEVVVNSFSYDYVTTFAESTIYDGGKDVSSEFFYSGKSIELHINEYSNWWPFTKDDDFTRIYKYNFSKKDFSTEITVFKNDKTSYVISEDGIYKIIYCFEDKIIHLTYVNVMNNLHYSLVEGDSKYENISAFSSFSFNLKMKDAYDLRENKYYYAFGLNVSDLNFREFTVFGDDEKKLKETISEVDKNLSVDILDSDASVNGVKKKFFVKVVSPENGETVISSVYAYEIASSVQASVYLVDKEEKLVREHVYFRNLSKLKFKIIFNAPVTYSGLKYSIDGGASFNSLDDCSEKKTEIVFEHTVRSGSDFLGQFILKTNNSLGAIVRYEDVNVSVNYILKSSFEVDVSAPSINIFSDEDGNARNKYYVSVDVEEENVHHLYYYAAECRIKDRGNCVDAFDDSKKEIVDLGAVSGAILEIDEKFGKFNNVNLTLFVKVVDKSGNQSVFRYSGFIIDNVIVPKGEESKVIKSIDILEDGKIIGKKLVVAVPLEYNVSNVKYIPYGGEEKVCEMEESAASLLFSCLKIENYDFISKITIEMIDEINNMEQHIVDFRFELEKEGNFKVGNKDFIVHKGLEYEIEFKNYNRMTEDELIFDENVLGKFRDYFNFSRIPNVNDFSIELVYIEGEEQIILVEDVLSILVFPSVNSILEKIGNLRNFKACAFEKCDFAIYLKYQYKVEGVPQNRFVKITYIDNSNKYNIDNFVYERNFAYKSEFIEFDYKYLDNLNKNILSDVLVEKNILFKDVLGNEKVVDKIDTSKLGVYIVNESFSYNSINSFNLNYIVNVVDDEAPAIRLKGKEKIKLNVGEKFVDPSVFVSDNYDLDVVVNVKYDPELNVNKEGTYTLSYWCEDSSGNISEILVRTIIVESQNSKTVYLICGGIALATILIIVFATIIEVKKEKKRT